MRVSSDQIERVRDATNIVDLVAEHVRLKKRGRNFIGLCPFHNEKTPSFNVLEDKGIFKCFGCGKGGDVFSFLMQVEGLTFPEALQKLAKRANIELEGVQAEADEAIRSERESLLAMLREAAAFYYRTLRSPEGDKAREYLAGRGIEVRIKKASDPKGPKVLSIDEKFALGYAPEQPGRLIEHLLSKGFSIEKLEAGGLVARRDGGNDYERFRGRVIFPVFNATGRIVGFGGRVLPGSSKDVAKYINSPDTQVYHKSQILYGLYQAKDAIRRKGFAILVEGYADVIAVYQAGIENVVAASGTSLTIEQLQLLRRYTTSVVLLFDADTAGKNAAIRGIELAIEAGFDVNTVVLPAGEDPDSFIRAKGKDAFEAAVEHRQSFIETKAQWFEEQGAFRDPGQMAVAVRSIVETIAKVPDELKRAFFIQKLGERFHLSEQLLTAELAKLLSNKREEPERKLRSFDAPLIEEQEEEHHDNYDIAVTNSEGVLLEAMLADPVNVARLVEDTEFGLDLVAHPHVRELLSYLIQRVEEDDLPTISQLLDEFRGKPQFESLLTTYGMTQEHLSANWDDVITEEPHVQKARQAIMALERAAIDKRREELPKLVKQDPYSDEHLREMLELAERPELKKRLTQQISEEDE